MTQGTTLTFDEWTLHRATGEIEKHGKRSRLPDQAHLILEELVASPGELVTREHLIARLWPQGIVDFDASLNAAVRKLRSILGDDAETPRYVETVPRKGYRFVGRITDTIAVPVFATPKETPTHSWRPYWAIAGAIVLVAIGIVMAVLVMKPTAPPAQHLRLAIMPFENLSPDPANAFFADGMHEEILTALAIRSTNFDVISRTTMMSYKGKSLTAADVAKALNVTHVLEGSVRREGQTVRVTLQLIDARNDKHLWAQNYDRQLVNAMTLQSQVAEEVAAKLLVKLASNTDLLPPSSNPEAYDLYLQAKLSTRSLVLDTAIREGKQPEEWLNRAIALDPSFAAAYLERGFLRMGKFIAGYELSESNLQAARGDLETVRKLVGDVPSALVLEATFAFYVEWDARKMLRLIEMPQVVASNNPNVMARRAAGLGFVGRFDESSALFARAAELDPGNPSMFASWQVLLWSARRPAEALQVRRTYQRQAPGGYGSGYLVFAFTGQLDDWRITDTPVGDSIDAGVRLSERVQWLQHQNKFANALAAIEQSDLQMIRLGGMGTLRPTGIGHRPIAELHGWTKLLIGHTVGDSVGDKRSAARDGEIMLDFVKHEPGTKWNGWYLRLLSAEGALFNGNKAQAIADARAALAMTPARIPSMFLHANATAAKVFAWAGAEDEAVAVLEALSKGFPSLGPAAITRDPLYSLPLKSNARYKALAKRLEAEIAENQKLLVSMN